MLVVKTWFLSLSLRSLLSNFKPIPLKLGRLKSGPGRLPNKAGGEGALTFRCDIFFRGLRLRVFLGGGFFLILKVAVFYDSVFKEEWTGLFIR